MMTLRSAILAALVVLSGISGGSAAGGEAPTFEKDVRAVFKAYCLDCHGGGGTDSPKGNLDLRLRRFVVQGGDGGPAVVPGNVEESFLVERMKSGEMPPGEKKVPPEQIALIERWVAAGAPAARDEPTSLPPGIDITPEERAFWAFQPVKRVEPPPAAEPENARTPIDAFLMAGLRPKGIGFAPEADRRVLIRRVAFDLTGLPPSPAEVEAFVAESAPDAYERMVERYLASPHYGERWARHWLDVAGYADSEGNGNEDTPRPYAYKYRDYVIRALNADLPLDQFIAEQLAGDEMVPRPWTNLPVDQIDRLAATGFLRCAPDGTATGAADEPLAANQVVADTVKIVGSALLGLTVGCAQCHDHRYDPIPHSDYYRLRAVFEPALDPSHWLRPVQRRASLQTDADRAKAEAIEAEARVLEAAVEEKSKAAIAVALDKELAKFPDEARAALRAALDAPDKDRTEAQKALLASNPSVNINAGVLYQYDAKAAEEIKKEREAVAARRALKPVEDFVSVTTEAPGVVPETRLFHRGDHRQPKQTVIPGDLTITAPEGARFEIGADDPAVPTTGRRLAFARHLTDGKHPLVGRSLVNRIWLHHFGRGLVDSPGDFGALGKRPTHPELLDWLADELVKQGWRMKSLHRVILTSTAYRQSSNRDAEGRAADLDNALYGRYPIRRLDAEALRDRLLAVGGRLDRKAFGPAVAVSEDFVGQVLPADDSGRRSVYLQARRSKPVSFLAAFDAPAMAVNCEKRDGTTSAPQSLMLMNSDFVLKTATRLADRASAEATPGLAGGDSPSAEPSTADKAAQAWRLAYLRPISAEELAWAVAFLEGPAAPGAPRPTLADLCQQLISSNEFLYVD